MATADEYAQWIVANKEKKGSPEFETVAAAYRDAMQKQPSEQVHVDPQQKGEEGSYINNMLYGAAHRGNVAINALNPFANSEDAQRLEAEKNWVAQHKGAGLGESLADMAITAPAGGIAAIVPRVLATGAIEGATHAGDYADKLKETALGALGAGMGEGVAQGIGFLARPFKAVPGAIDDATQALRDKAAALGINLNAAQLTGNKTLAAIDKQLGNLPSSSEYQQAQREAQRLAWQKVLFAQGGENADMATQQVMGDMKNRIGGVYNDIAGRNDLLVDPQFKADLASVSEKLLSRIPTNQKPIVESYLKDFGKAPEGAAISGREYQDIRSMLDKQAKSFRNSDPATYDALSSIRKAADSAMERTLTTPRGGVLPSNFNGAEDWANWQKANKDWMVMKTIEKAVDPTTETIRPNILLNALKQRDPNRVIYGQGDQALTDIAKVGNKFIPERSPDSGTAINSAIVKALTGGGVFGGAVGTDYAINHNPAEAAGVGASSLLASILLPKAAAKAMWNPNGYLAKGLADMTREAVPGLTRQRLLSEILRNAGTQSLESLGQ